MKTMIIFSAILYLLCLPEAKGSNDCKTSDGVHGICSIVNDCSYIKHVYQKTPSSDELNSTLTVAKCNGTKEVCCPRCGISNVFYNPRTSQRLELGTFPWMAALAYETNGSSIEFKCLGSLISEKWALTAASCVRGTNYQALKFIRLGEFDPNEKVKDGAQVQDIPLEEIIVHPNYTDKALANDIALIQLKNAAKINVQYVHPICIPNEKFNMSDSYLGRKIAIFPTWSFLQSFHSDSIRHSIHYAKVLQITSPQKCKEYLKSINMQADNYTMCFNNRHLSSCEVNTGGPVILIESVNKQYYYYQVGIISSAESCNGTNFLSERIDKFYDWILHITKSSLLAFAL